MARRNNEDRIGAPQVPADLPMPDLVEQQGQTSNQFSYPAPTEFVDLPSQGKFYPSTHPLHGRDTLEIRFMTAKDEDILTSPALLRKGLALDRFLQNVIIDKAVKVNDLLVCDKNALVVRSRVTGYGADYQTKVACPACGSTSEHNFNLDEGKIITADDLIAQGVQINEQGLIQIELPRTGATVMTRMLTGHDEARLVNKKGSPNQMVPPNFLTNQLKAIIVSVDGNEDRGFINSFVDSLPALDSRHLRKEYAKSTPSVDLTQFFSCPSCFFEEEMEVPFTSDFFWPK